MKRGQTEEALGLYDADVKSDQDKLLKLMDRGILLRSAGRFAESNSQFFEAAKIIDMNGYISLAESTATVLVNEKQQTYQGEDFEKVLVHLYLGLNFVSLNQSDEALVETRRVNEILYKMISEAKRPYELNAFARYLGGALFEEDADWNNALVAYRNTLKIDLKLDSYFPILRQDLIRMAKQMGMEQELAEFKKAYGDKIFDEAVQTLRDKMGSVLLLFECGKSPQKFSSRERRVKEGRGGTAIEVVIPIAYYEKRESRIRSALLEVADKKVSTATLNSVETTAISQLKDRMGRAIAKALLSAGVKTGIAAGVGAAVDSKELGILTGIALMLISEADTRSWLLLPAELQVAKLFIAPGKYSAKISYLDQYGNPVESETFELQVKSRKATILQRRKFD